MKYEFETLAGYDVSFEDYEEYKDPFETKYLVEYSEDNEYWERIDNHPVIEDASDEMHAIEIAKEKIMEMYGDEVTIEEVNSWTWRAAEVLDETELIYKTYYETSEFVYAA